MPNERTTHLFLEGKCKDEIVKATIDFTDLEEAYKFTGSFNRGELEKFFKEQTGKEITDFELVKIFESGRKDITYPLFYKKHCKCLTPENLTNVVINNATNYEFTKRIKNDPYCKSILDQENVIKAAPCNRNKDYRDMRLNYDDAFLVNLENIKDERDAHLYENIIKAEMKVFIERLLYSSFNKNEVEKAKKSGKYNMGALVTLFNNYVSKKDLKYIIPVIKDEVSDKTKYIQPELYYEETLDQMAKNKEEDDREEYKPEEPIIGDGRVENPYYVDKADASYIGNSFQIVYKKEVYTFKNPEAAKKFFEKNQIVLSEIDREIREHEEMKQEYKDSENIKK